MYVMEHTPEATAAVIDAVTMKLASRIRYERTKRGYSIRKLAVLVPCAPSQIMLWEHGKAMPDLASRIKLSRALGISHDTLFSVDGLLTD